MTQKIENLGQKIKELRKELGLSQETLAKKLFLDKSTVAKYETGEISPSLEVLREMAILFKVSTDYLLDLKD